MGTTALAGAILIGPGSVVAALNAGALYGERLLWAVALSAVVAAAVGYLAAKVAAVTGLTTFQMLDRHVLGGLGRLTAYVQIPVHVLAVMCVACTLADVLEAMLPGLPGMFTLTALLGLSLYAWVWAGGFGWVRRFTAVLVLAMAVTFVGIAASLRWLPGHLNGLVPWLPQGTPGLLVVMGLVGGSSGSAALLILPYQVKAAGLGEGDSLRLAWDAFLFMGVAFGIVSVGTLAAGDAVSQGEGVRNALQAAEMLGARWPAPVRWVFLLGLFGAVWTTAAAPCYAPGLFLADVHEWRGPGGERIVDSDPHADRRFKVVTSAAMCAWLGGLLVARVLPPFYVLMFALGVINLAVPLLVGAFLVTGCRRSIMGEAVFGWPMRVLGAVAFLFSWWGVVAFIRFLAGLLG